MRKIVLMGALATASGFGAYLIMKKKKIDRVLDKLTFSVKDVKNFKISSGNLKADLYLRAQNPTNESLDVSTGFLTVDTLRVYEKGTSKTLAVSDLQINQIELPAGGFYDFPALSVKIPLLTGAIIALSQLTNNKSKFIDRLTIELDVKAMNYTKTITIN
ncbi:hypothetical protein [Tenacibaculum caenipelagi]|uniref:Late embryogenesis abundant protein n=1 Tax=Tenacibaculum caenipelagi TaxID=1325435 RepID=A0A4V3D2S6_9FLAO|nr:hypothetical protein [Tenacibaculum caenipelagi]TDQ22745.1 hypothetical protein DFQ07_2763 [Tenacibaculum caenipelagi]